MHQWLVLTGNKRRTAWVLAASLVGVGFAGAVINRAVAQPAAGQSQTAQSPPVRTPSGAVTLPVPASLQQELAAALKAGQPLVLMVSLDGCPYCKIARENYLAPLVREQGLRVVQINMQHREALKDLQGRDTTQAQLIADLKVSVAPTLLFYGRGGQEAAPRLEGMGSLDFYGAYLEQRVQAARQTLR